MAARKLKAEEINKTVLVVKKHGGNQVRAAAELGISRSTLQHRMLAAGRSTVSAREDKPVGYTRDDFRARYDKSYIVPNRIREALKKLGAGRYLPEGDFIKLAGLSQTDLSAYRHMFEDDYIVMVERTKRLWCGSKALAAEFRGDNG